MNLNVSDDVINLMAEKFKMLAQPTRLVIVRSLIAGEKSVNSLVHETGRGQANLSKHLKVLADAGLVARRKVGLQVFYRVGSPLIDQVCSLACDTVAGDSQETG